MKKRFFSILLSFGMAASLPAAVSFAEGEAADIKIGDYLEMGTYYGEPILWRCAAYEKIKGYDEETGIPLIDSTDTVTEYEEGYIPLMVSDRIICLKSFDAGTSENSTTGSHSRDKYDGRASGSNYWGDSNMRSWLNSEAAAGEVEWLCGNPPDEAHVWYGYNDYAGEAGFLSNFSADERGAMQTVDQKSIVGACEWSKRYYTSGNAAHEFKNLIDEAAGNYSSAYSETVTDTMFLLDVKQVNTIYNNSNILGEDYFRAKLTDKAVSHSEFIGRNGFEGGEKWHYWLRTPNAGVGLYGYFDEYTDYYDVGTRNIDRYWTSGQGDVSYDRAYYGSIGVRPAFYLTLGTDFSGGKGSAEKPYTGAYVPQTDIEVKLEGNTVTNLSGYGGRASIIAAYYGADGTLANVTIENTELAASGETGDSYTVSGDGDSARRIFVWSSVSGMRPLEINEKGN